MSIEFAEQFQDVPAAEENQRPPLQPFSWDELEKPVSHENTLLGDRFLERGCGLILYGPSGCGKSVAALQACAEWSAGLDGLHIPATRGPLRIVVIQTEDSKDDIAETMQGIRASTMLKPEHHKLIRENLIILPPVPGGSPDTLINVIDQAVCQFKPDLINVNPLLAFCPGDPTREMGGILYQFIDPTIKRCRVGFLGVHHTPKMNNRDTTGYGRHDHQYLAAGDARVANWPRAMIMIEEAKFPVYRFRITKRGNRVGWTCDLKPTTERYFRHHQSEIRWVDASEQDVAEVKVNEDYRRILTVLPEGGGISRERMHVLAKQKLGMGKNKADECLKLVREDGTAIEIKEKNQNSRWEITFHRKAEDAP